MPTSVPLDPLAEEALTRLKARLEKEEGRSASNREVVSALIYGATPAQTAGMIISFTRARAASATGSGESGESEG